MCLNNVESLEGDLDGEGDLEREGGTEADFLEGDLDLALLSILN